MENYKVELDTYNGPLDLLLYLIRRDEIDIHDIPIVRITEQYCQYAELFQSIDPNVAGEFLVMAATLMLIKSQMLLPSVPDDEEDTEDLDPRAELVRQLLEYKRFKDAAQDLGVAAHLRAMRFARLAGATPQSQAEPDVDLEDLQIWDLVTAFNRLMMQVGHGPVTHDVVYDDTPVALHAADIQDRLGREGSLTFEAIFEGRPRGEMVGLFLATLELIRRKRIRIEQDGLFGAIYVHLLDSTPLEMIEEPGTEPPDAALLAADNGRDSDDLAEGDDEFDGDHEPLDDDELGDLAEVTIKLAIDDDGGGGGGERIDRDAEDDVIDAPDEGDQPDDA